VISDEDKRFMKMACDLASENVEQGGVPFGCVIVKDGELIAAAADTVSLDNDPTAHALINAIRRACSLLRKNKLEGCVVYSSCEPCSMCLSALYWAGVSRIYFGSTRADADRIICSDGGIHKEMEKPYLERAIPCIHMEETTAIDAFNKWAAKEDKIEH
jgi:tRNA(Arg) A34 adenosine deaminase TadA